MDKHKCRLEGCDFTSKFAQGIAKHETGHVSRGEAIRQGDDLIRVNGSPPAAGPLTGIPKTQPNSGADKVRQILAELPPKFTVKDVRSRLPALPPASASAALRWCLNHGYIKSHGQISYKEYKAAGNMGAPPVVYSFVSMNGHAPKKNGSKKKPSSAGSRALALRHPSDNAEIQQPVRQVEIEPEVSPQEQFAIDAAMSHNALRNLQSAAALMQFSVLMEQVGPEQAVAMVAGMSKLGKALTRR
jgi:hypothetical protein